MQSLEKKNLKYNIIVNLLDGSFFGFALGFASYTTIIPLFVAMMTNSAILIGLIPAIHNMGWQLPQLLIAKKISRKEKLRPLVLALTTQERLPIIGLAVVAMLLPELGNTLALVITFCLLIMQGLAAGFTANAWQIVISKIIPSDIRATFFGAQSAGSNLLSSIGAIAAGALLVKFAQPTGYIYCFLIAGLLYGVSWFFFFLTKEPIRTIDPQTESVQPLWHDVKKILQHDKHFRNYLISRFISQFGMMAFAFYTVFAVTKLGMSTITIGIMTSVLMITQVIANPILGRIADKWSRKWVLIFGGIAAAVSSFLALLIKDPALFSFVFILNGIANTAFWTIGLTISLEFGNEENRPTYVGMSNTLIAPSAILAPLLGGFLADQFGYSTTFITSAIFGIISTIILLILVQEPGKQRNEI